MCGLVGLIHNTLNGFNVKDLDVFEQMLYVDALRGEDATGVACITTEQGAKVFKEASHSAYFVYDKDYDKQRSSFLRDGKALLGHNRKATIGKKVDENAHPFVYDDRYIFFHNGTLNNHRALADTEVDSEALGLHLTKCNGDVTKIGELLDRVTGAYACVWYDADKHTVYMLRNFERPLNIVLFENGSIAYASETWIAIGPAIRNHYKVKETYSLDPGHLYSIKLDAISCSVVKEAIPKKALPLVSTIMHTGGKMINGVKKREIKGILSHLKANYIGFFVDDFQCQSFEPEDTEVYDWLFTGSYEDFPGVVFKYIGKDMFPWEANEMLGKYVSAIYDTHQFVKGNVLEVYVKNVVWKPSKPQVHVCH